MNVTTTDRITRRRHRRGRGRAATVLVGSAVAIGLLTGPAAAMQPPGGPAQDRFGCVDGEDQAIAGHPGAAGLVHATPRVGALTGNPMPTAWNAVANADPIELGGC